jgi:hypothetical protein
MNTGCLDAKLLQSILDPDKIKHHIRTELDKIEQIRLDVHEKSFKLITLLATMLVSIHTRVLSDALLSYHVCTNIFTTITSNNVLPYPASVVPIHKLPSETVSHVLTFCQPIELNNFAQTCKYAHSLVFSDDSASANWIWRELSLNMNMRDPHRESFALTQGNKTWRDEYRTMLNYRFKDLYIHSHLRNYGATIENTEHEWLTMRGRTPGKIYRFEIILNQYAQVSHNSYIIQFGIETPQFPFKTQNHFSDVIACQEHFGGVGLLLGVGRVRYKGHCRKYCNAMFRTGDVVGIVVDMTKSSTHADEKILRFMANRGRIPSNTELRTNIGGAKIEYFRNGESLGVAYQNIPGLAFYPTVSLVQDQIVTLKYWSPQVGPSCS